MNVKPLCTYDLYGHVRNAFDADSIHYLGKWEGVGPLSQGPKNSQFPGPNPLPLVLVKDAACIKSIKHGAV